MSDKKRIKVDNLDEITCPNCEEMDFIFFSEDEEYDYHCDYCQADFNIYED